MVPTNTSTEHDDWLNYDRHAMLNTPLIDLFTFEIVFIMGGNYQRITNITY